MLDDKKDLSIEEYKKKGDIAIRKILEIMERAQKKVDALEYKKRLSKLNQKPL